MNVIKKIQAGIVPMNKALSALDDAIDVWHNSENIKVPLHEHLGMTWEEYKLFAEKPHTHIEWMVSMLQLAQKR